MNDLRVLLEILQMWQTLGVANRTDLSRYITQVAMVHDYTTPELKRMKHTLETLNIFCDDGSAAELIAEINEELLERI